jgi:hypothetical protein
MDTNTQADIIEIRTSTKGARIPVRVSEKFINTVTEQCTKLGLTPSESNNSGLIRAYVEAGMQGDKVIYIVAFRVPNTDASKALAKSLDDTARQMRVVATSLAAILQMFKISMQPMPEKVIADLLAASASLEARRKLLLEQHATLTKSLYAFCLVRQDQAKLLKIVYEPLANKRKFGTKLLQLEECFMLAMDLLGYCPSTTNSPGGPT